jgi:thiamine biosynthesis lipoprotein
MTYKHHTFSGIGTTWDVSLPDSCADSQAEALIQSIKARIDVFDKAYSRFRADSLITEISKKAGSYHLPADAQPMMDLYKKMYDITQGKVTPLIGTVISDAGYDASYSLKPKDLIASAPHWENVLEYTANTDGSVELTTKIPVLLDFGAAGKGYLVDIVAHILKDAGLRDFIVNAGGDIAYENETSGSNGTDSGNDANLKVGLENPDNTEQAIGIVEIPSGKSICGSAINRRAWDRFHHIIDPDTVSSPQHIIALWTVADSTLLADGMATALFFKDGKDLQKEFNFEYALVRADHSVEQSPGFPGSFFS